MKARNPSTGTLETVYVKALDSMPVGTIVDFDGQASDIPTGWEETDNVLYDDNTGTNGTVTLSDSISNYSYLEIYYKNANSFAYSIKIPTDYTSFPISAIWAGSDGTTYFASCEKLMSGNTISTDGTRYSTCYNTGSTVGGQQANELKITRVIGIK